MASPAKTAKPGPRPGRAAGRASGKPQEAERDLVVQLAEQEWNGFLAELRDFSDLRGSQMKPPRYSARKVALMCAQKVISEMRPDFGISDHVYKTPEFYFKAENWRPEVSLALDPELAVDRGRAYNPAIKYVAFARQHRAEARGWRLLRRADEIQAEDTAIKEALENWMWRRYAAILASRRRPPSPPGCGRAG